MGTFRLTSPTTVHTTNAAPCGVIPCLQTIQHPHPPSHLLSPNALLTTLPAPCRTPAPDATLDILLHALPSRHTATACAHTHTLLCLIVFALTAPYEPLTPTNRARPTLGTLPIFPIALGPILLAHRCPNCNPPRLPHNAWPHRSLAPSAASCH